jgi:hypothetical protein
MAWGFMATSLAGFIDEFNHDDNRRGERGMAVG